MNTDVDDGSCFNMLEVLSHALILDYVLKKQASVHS
jgi:hypothetical protein